MVNYRDEETSAGIDGMPTVHVGSVAVFLDALIAKGASKEPADSTPAQIPQLRLFDSSRFPQVSLYDYLERMKKYAHFDEALVIALIYIDRLLAADDSFALTHRNVHRLLLTCVTVAEKHINDRPYFNTYYASVGGVSLGELNRLEVALLYALKWQLGVSLEEYKDKQEDTRLAFADLLAASALTEWIVLKEAVCETQREPGSEKLLSEYPSESTICGTESVSDASESMDYEWDNSSEVA
jgi:hypothetical protein